jgi:hypothetical protein
MVCGNCGLMKSHYSELEGMWEESVVSFEVLVFYRYFLEGTEEAKPQHSSVGAKKTLLQ